jgi:hypothetical protein
MFALQSREAQHRKSIKLKLGSVVLSDEAAVILLPELK